MTDKDPDHQIPTTGLVSRRSFLAASAGAAALGADSALAEQRISVAQAAAAESKTAVPKAPFDTLRDYVAALEANGLLLRFNKVDQDAYEGTAIVYALIDKYGWYEAPAVLFESVKQDGKWIKGPVVINHQGHWDTECITFGLEPADTPRESYQRALDYTRLELSQAFEKTASNAGNVAKHH